VAETVQSIEICAPAERVFAAACGLDPRMIFLAYGVLPGVEAIAGHTAPWSAIGERRIVTLTDGSSLQEELARFDAGQSFLYNISGFSGALASLAAGGEGEWAVERAGQNSRLSWRYSLVPRSRLTAPAVALVVKMLMPGYMRAALKRIKSSLAPGEAT
jgi:hypothetical protein